MTDDETPDIDAIEYAKGIMGKSCEPKYANPSWLVRTIREIKATVEEDLNPSQFKFEDTLGGAEWNANVLQKYAYDFEKAVQSENNTILKPGAEFRNINNIEKIGNIMQIGTK